MALSHCRRYLNRDHLGTVVGISAKLLKHVSIFFPVMMQNDNAFKAQNRSLDKKVSEPA